MIVIAGIFLIVFGIDVGWHRHDHDAPERVSQQAISETFPAQSWDQENLKKDDHGCPTAVFVAPNGNLRQCDE